MKTVSHNISREIATSSTERLFSSLKAEAELTYAIMEAEWTNIHEITFTLIDTLSSGNELS